MEKFLIVSHVFCGITVLLLGLIQMLNRKGGRSHIVLGKVYIGAMWWICLSALFIISFYRFSAFLMVIAVLTFYSSFVGVRVLKRKTNNEEKWYDWAVAILTACFGVGLISYGIYVAFRHPGNAIFVSLCSLFGALTFLNAFRDLRFFIKKNPKNKLWWLRQHIGAMGGSYIAAVTAFAVQNPDIFIANNSYHWLLWVLPSVIGSPIISITIRKWIKPAQAT